MIIEIKYSCLGTYESLESTPLFLAKLQTLYSKLNMIPNTITLQEFSNLEMKVKYRPQLIDLSTGITIDFLPDRIDIVWRKQTTDANLEMLNAKANSLFELISSYVEIKPQRFALFAKGVQTEKNNTKLFNNVEYFNEHTFIEWATRYVHRKDIILKDRNEKLNIVVINEKLENVVIMENGPYKQKYDGIIFSIDINTFIPSSFGDFDYNYFRLFNKEAYVELNETIRILDLINQ